MTIPKQETTQKGHHTKAFKMNVKDAEKGTVEAVIARFNVKDHDGDWTLPGAFEDGAEVVISAYGHTSWRGQLPVGRGKIRATATEAILEGQFFLDTPHGLDTFRTVKNLTDLQEWSYGFDIVETGELTEPLRQSGVYQVLKKVRPYEACPVLRGAGIETRTVDVKERTEDPPASSDDATRAKGRGEFAKFMKTTHRLDG